MTLFPDARNYPEAKDVVTRLRDDGHGPEGYILPTYTAFQTWSQAAVEVGSLNLTEMIKALHTAEFQTVVAKFKFNKKGDTTAPDFVWYG